MRNPLQCISFSIKVEEEEEGEEEEEEGSRVDGGEMDKSFKHRRI
jgi:hypothetical protein